MIKQKKHLLLFAAVLIMVIIGILVSHTFRKRAEDTVNDIMLDSPIENGNINIGYFLNGGIQNEYNKTEYPSYSGYYRLQEPYRFGYRFAGWFTDRGMHKKVERINTDEKRSYVLYAKWVPRINNRYNVNHYKYHTPQKSAKKRARRLKDLEFTFMYKLDIPGMPETREDDLLKRYIFSEAQCPQGICLTDEFVLITSYSSEDHCMGELMVFEKDSGEYLTTLGMDENSHLGGIAFDGENVWVCNSYENTIERISYDFIQHMAYQNRGEVVDVREVVDEYKVKNTPSCITYYGGRLWVASHKIILNSKMVAYHFDEDSNKLISLSSFRIPAKVQGVAFDENGKVFLSTSYGRSISSYLKVYSSVSDLATKPSNPEMKVEMPPCSEEIDINSGYVYVVFESAGEKYVNGTDGKGKSLSPLDKLLMIPVDEFT